MIVMHSTSSLLIYIPACLTLMAAAMSDDLAQMRVISVAAQPVRLSAEITSQRQPLRARPQKAHGLDREKEQARAEFSRHFAGLQNTGYALRNEHEAHTLKPGKLEKYARAVNKHARTLRTLVVLGELDEPVRESREPLDNSKKFDQSIHQLARLIYSFAHNPVHQNHRVFDTDQARRARADLEHIIVLSKSLGKQAKGYTTD